MIFLPSSAGSHFNHSGRRWGEPERQSVNHSSRRWGEPDQEKGPVDLFPGEPTEGGAVLPLRT